MARLMLITLCLALGFSAVAIPTAYGGIASAGVPNPPITSQSDTLNAAQAACAVLNTFQRVTECYVREFNPSIDVTIVATRNEAISLCNDASKVVRDRAAGVAGKGWALRIIAPSTLTPTAVCRVT